MGDWRLGDWEIGEQGGKESRVRKSEGEKEERLVKSE